MCIKLTVLQYVMHAPSKGTFNETGQYIRNTPIVYYNVKSFTMSLARSLRNSPYMRLASSKRWRWNLLLMDSDPIRGPNNLRENLQA